MVAAAEKVGLKRCRITCRFELGTGPEATECRVELDIGPVRFNGQY